MAKNKAKHKGVLDFQKGIRPVSKTGQHAKILVYGPNGRGKTTFCGTWPKALILDVNEKGTRSVKKLIEKGELEDADVREISSWAQLMYAYWYLRDGNHEYETVIIDTLTQAQNLAMRKVLKNLEDRDPNREPNMPDKRAWGKLAEIIKPWIFDMRNLPMNVIFVCQKRDQSEGEDEDLIITKVPAMSPSIRGAVMDAVEVIGYCNRRKVRTVKKQGKKKKTGTKWIYYMLVGPHEEIETKLRGYDLPDIIINPSSQHFLEN